MIVKTLNKPVPQYSKIDEVSKKGILPSAYLRYICWGKLTTVNFPGSDPGATEDKAWGKHLRERTRSCCLANQGTSCSARAGSPGYSCLVSFDNYYGMVTNVCFPFSVFRMDRFIAMICSFSTIENLNVLMAENMSWVYWLPAYKEPNLGFLERASLSPRYLRQWIWCSNRKRLKSWPLGEGVRLFYVWKQRCACRIGKPEAEQDRKC